LAFARFLVRLPTYFGHESFRMNRGLWCADAERPGVVGIGAPVVWLAREVFGCSSVVRIRLFFSWVIRDIDKVGGPVVAPYRLVPLTAVCGMT
jgi:hypothetical protein